jgi:hypothetical protein
VANGGQLAAMGGEHTVKCGFKATRIFHICGSSEHVYYCNGHDLGTDIPKLKVNTEYPIETRLNNDIQNKKGGG